MIQYSQRPGGQLNPVPFEIKTSFLRVPVYSAKSNIPWKTIYLIYKFLAQNLVVCRVSKESLKQHESSSLHLLLYNSI